MVNRLSVLPLFVVVLCVTVFSAEATLIDSGDGTITDDTTNLMWLQDANTALTSGYDTDGRMTWDEANGWIHSLNSANYKGHNDWRLPTSDTCYGFNCIGSELGYMFYTSLGNSVGSLTNTGPFGSTLQPEAYWLGTEYNTDLAWAFDFAIGYQYHISKLDLPLAWAVRDVTAIPEPASLILLGSGLVGVMGLKRKSKK